MLKRSTAKLLAVYGRRRVGNTYLMSAHLKQHIVFELTGMYQRPLSKLLATFSASIQQATGSPLAIKPPESWIDAVKALELTLAHIHSDKKKVLVLDEFPWLDGRRSGFRSPFNHFWNTWASRYSDLLVVICGSAASWMLRHIVNNKGELHNCKEGRQRWSSSASRRDLSFRQRLKEINRLSKRKR